MRGPSLLRGDDMEPKWYISIWPFDVSSKHEKTIGPFSESKAKTIFNEFVNYSGRPATISLEQGGVVVAEKFV